MITDIRNRYKSLCEELLALGWSLTADASVLTKSSFTVTLEHDEGVIYYVITDTIFEASLDRVQDDLNMTTQESATKIDSWVPRDFSRSEIIPAELAAISDYLSPIQRKSLLHLINSSKESGSYKSRVLDLGTLISSMPVTGDTEKLGDSATVQLHYFIGSWDYYITEKDIDGGVDQAFGVVVNDYGTEYGYISIKEICKVGAELDLHWQPKTLGKLIEENKVN
jgi:hypothetical protein